MSPESSADADAVLARLAFELPPESIAQTGAEPRDSSRLMVVGERIEHRPVLGSGRSPAPYDVARALDLARRVDTASALVAVLLALICGGRHPRRQL